MIDILLVIGGIILFYVLIDMTSRILDGLEVRRNQKQARRGCRPLLEGRERGKSEVPPCKPQPTDPPPSNRRPPSKE